MHAWSWRMRVLNLVVCPFVVMATAAVAAGFLISVAVRFARVNFKLRNLEVR